MKRRALIVMGIAVFSLLVFCLVFHGAMATVEWVRTYSVGVDDHVRSVVQTSDGGYVLAGNTQGNNTDRQALIVKTDSSGNIQWERTYGDVYTDEAHAIVPTSDGGYAVAGVTWPSNDSGHFWIFKINASGNVQWNRTYGGPHNDNAWSLVGTSDGGYAITGFTNNFGLGDSDFWLIKTDTSGAEQWNRTYGTTGNDVAYSVIQTSDGGYAMTGRQNGHQCWLVKTDSSGTMQWNQTYGDATVNSTGYSLVQTSDSGYAIGGFTGSLNGSTSMPYDFLLVKTNASGDLEWNQTYGGASEEIARSIAQTPDGGYVLAGYTESFGAGNQDVWLVKTDSSGNMQWNQTFGGGGTDVANSMIRTNDGGYALGGSTESFGSAGPAFLLVKMDSMGPSPILSNPETSAWTPQPTNAVAATVVATIATAGVSIAVAAAIAPAGLPTDRVTQKTSDLLPEAVKKWLADLMSSKRKPAVDEKTVSPFMPTKSEVIAYSISIAVLGFCFSYVKVDSLPQILAVLPIILGTSILVGFVKAFISTVYSRKRGVWTEHKLWYLGLATFLVTTFAFRVPFSSPSRNVHYAPRSTKRLDAILSSAEIFISLAFAGFFCLLLIGGFKAIGSIGLAMCIIGAFFDTFPIAPMGGRTIFDHSKLLWVVLFIFTLALYVSWLLLM